MQLDVNPERLKLGYERVRDQLLSERNDSGYWTGQLSTSALSTATAIMAMQQVILQDLQRKEEFEPLIQAGLKWLAEHQNSDGGWGDTVKSKSNISTTMLAHAVFHATYSVELYSSVVSHAKNYCDKLGGIDAVVKRYGKDKTFSVPILTHCALAGQVDWKHVSALPFELACLPHKFYATIRLPVVSYALPALIAIGQVRHHFRKSRNPFLSWLRNSAVEKSLRVLKKIQPDSGGFLEATPLTSFVVMSLAAKGQAHHQVVERGLSFIKKSVLEDGSWPIDTNLATWTTTLSVNALGEDIDLINQNAVLDWLLNQQYREIHPYTNAAPGGWAWTDLTGGVPDADDTPGAMLAIMQLASQDCQAEMKQSTDFAAKWLLDLQNRDGGWPTFCRGWGALPFDRSSPDITAHGIRALSAVSKQGSSHSSRIAAAIKNGFRFLNRQQLEDGSWLPLWFGNQDAPNDINPVYGTSKVIAAYRDCGRLEALPAKAGLRWLKNSQNNDGGWGGVLGVTASVEETALATETLLCSEDAAREVSLGLNWLLERVEAGTIGETAPIGFYFAKLWYFERLYPLIFATSALRMALDTVQKSPSVTD